MINFSVRMVVPVRLELQAFMATQLFFFFFFILDILSIYRIFRINRWRNILCRTLICGLIASLDPVHRTNVQLSSWNLELAHPNPA